jgi:hypothetical protein
VSFSLIECATVVLRCIVSISYGRTKNGAAHFPDWAKGRWNLVLDLMKEYLAVAFGK